MALGKGGEIGQNEDDGNEGDEKQITFSGNNLDPNFFSKRRHDTEDNNEDAEVYPYTSTLTLLNPNPNPNPYPNPIKPEPEPYR